MNSFIFRIVLFLAAAGICSAHENPQQSESAATPGPSRLRVLEAKAAFLSAEEAFEKKDYTGALKLLDDARASFGAANTPMLNLQALIEAELARTDSTYVFKALKTISRLEKAPDFDRLGEDKALEAMKLKLRLKKEVESKALKDPNAPLKSAFAGYLISIKSSEAASGDVNEEEALNLVRKRAGDGDALAECWMGVLYDNGLIVEEDKREAVRWYQRAASRGQRDAQNNLANKLFLGEGLAKDTGEAVKWYRMAAEQGMVSAQSALGARYYDGDGIEQSFQEAYKWCRKAADAGDPAAQYRLAVMCERGEGVTQNLADSLAWIRKAAEHGLPRAQHGLAIRYYDGKGVEKNLEEAARWYLKAALQGYEPAQFMMGAICDEGEGVPKNPKEAAQWYLKAAEQGNRHAQYIVAAYYETGKGIEKSRPDAIKWFRRAAENGVEGAQSRLADLEAADK